MITIAEIQSYTFEKAMFNGYDMRSVDELIERITEDFATLQKENAMLKSKMKVLVEKVDEYRHVEDNIRLTLVSAQDIAKDILAKANAEAAVITSAAQSMADVRANELKSQFVAEEARLEDAKRKNAEFAARLTVVYEAQIKTLIKLTNSTELNAEPKESTQRIAHQTTADVPTFEQTAPMPVITSVEKAAPVKVVDKGTAKFDFGELKFGNGYNPNKE